MRSRLLLTTALCAVPVVAPKPAQSEPVTALISLLATPSLGSLSIFGVAVGAGTVGGAVLRLGASFLLQAAAQRLTRRRIRQQDIKRELADPQSRAVKRSVYGRHMATGTPVRPVEVENPLWPSGVETVLYCAYLLNSRPSAGNFTVHFDQREGQVVEGDIYDLNGPGATIEPVDPDHSFGSGADRPRVWICRGDQNAPPAEILAEAGSEFRETDIGRGLTLIWVRIPRGPNNTWFDRWPGWPPVVEVEGDYALVWDPRDPAQDPDDPSTWQWSNNQALCLLDAILNNPIRKRPRWLVDIDAFAAAADIADQSVARFYEGGTVPRYTANGVLVWRDAEIMDQVAPLAEAGGGDLIQVGGLISYVPPVARAPSYQIREFLQDGGFEFTRLRPGSELPLAVRGSYVNPARGWSEADLPALAVGAGSTQIGDDGVRELPMPFVTEATQGMRLQKIARNRIAAQKGLRLTLPADAINLVGGSIAEWDIPELPKCAGLWRVASINPAAWMDDDGVAFRCPVELAEEPANVDAWNPEVDEFELATEDYTPPAPVRVPPADLTATTGPGVAAGSVPRIRFSFEAVSGNVIGYEWQWREVGGEFAEGGSISENVRDALGRVFGFLVPVLPGVEYQIRVRTIYLGGVSGWVDYTITAQGPDFELAIGGTVTEYQENGQWWRQHTFAEDGTFTCAISLNLDVVIRDGGAGGGRAGASTGGGGGAGGMALGATLNLTPGAYPVLVGAGGIGSDTSGQRGNDGGKSEFAGLVAPGAGAGGGGGFGTAVNNGGDGSSGGGAYGLSLATGGAGDPGFKGGDSLYSGSAGSRGGGGGGAPGSAGGDGPANIGEASGSGGAGITLWDGEGSGGGSGGRGSGAGNSVGATSHGGGLGGEAGEPGQDGQLPGAGGGGGGSNAAKGGDGAPGRVTVRYRIAAPV